MSWIALHPEVYVSERRMLERHYPDLRVDEVGLAEGRLVVYGEIVVRPPGGSKTHPICLHYPSAFPFEYPIVIPLECNPDWDEHGGVKGRPQPKFLDHRHQMPRGNLCLFQRETRKPSAKMALTGVDMLRRAEKYFLGHHTGHWPPDTAESELEAHFQQLDDVLVPSTFHKIDLSGLGRLFLVVDGSRLAMTPHGTEVPFILTALTEESQKVIKTFDARNELMRLYPWMADAAWDASPRAAALQDVMKQDGRFRHGYWWSLPSEPAPFRDGAGLIRELSAIAPGGDGWSLVSSLLGADLVSAEYHLLALQYPSRESGHEWLITVMPRENRKEKGGVVLASEVEKKRAFESAPIHALRSHRLEPSTLRRRNTGVVYDGIGKKMVSLIGLGALGSPVAELLAKAGVGHFRLCDYDRLNTGNVARHIGRISDFGLRKTEVVTRRLLEINPYLEWQNDDVLLSATQSSEDLAKFMSGTDLTICTVADEAVESFINEVGTVQDHPVLYGRSLRSASMGRVFLVRPRRDACKACLGTYLRDGREGRDTPADWVDVQEEDEGILLHECGRPVIAGSAVDLASISALIARVALDFLEGKDNQGNHWLWSSPPAAEVDPRLSSRFAVLEGSLSPRPDCLVCREPDVTQLVLNKGCRDGIIAETEAHPDVETGGLLLGFVDEDRTAVVVRATGPGPNAKRSRSEFRRDVEYAQGEVERAAAEYGDRGLYIGEWHSHLVPDPQPSALDAESLSGISAVPNYLTKCPVLLIAGLDTSSGKVATLRSWSFPVGGRTYEIQNRVAPDTALG